jgi:hypothetical protein
MNLIEYAIRDTPMHNSFNIVFDAVDQKLHNRIVDAVEIAIGRQVRHEVRWAVVNDLMQIAGFVFVP